MAENEAMHSDDPTKTLIWRLDWQIAPGCKTQSIGVCGHWSRGGWTCGECLDAELLRRGIDLAKGGSQYTYERVDGRLRRKLKGDSH
jgi:hypothetical protein